VRVLLNTFLSVVPGVLVGLVVYCGRGVLCGWEDAGSDVIPARRGFCVDGLRVYPVTIVLHQVGN
jgi:hypothetical protein